MNSRCRASAGAAVSLAAFILFSGCGGKTTTIPWTPTVAVTGVSPASGPPAGGGRVSVFGLLFENGAGVQFNGAVAANRAFVSSTQIDCDVPAGTNGPATVMVVNPDGKSASLAGGYEYDGTAPAAVTGLTVTGQMNAGFPSILLAWTNPADADFAGVTVRRSLSGHPATISDGILVYSGNSAAFTDTEVVKNVWYFYSVFAFDEIPNHSGPASGDAAASDAPVITAYPPIFQDQAVGGKVYFWADASDPDGTIELVETDLSAIGGSATQQLYDNGAYGDLIPGDGVYMYLATVGSGTAVGSYNLTITAYDDAGESTSAATTLKVTRLLLDLGNKRVETDPTGTWLSYSPMISCEGDSVAVVWGQAQTLISSPIIYSNASLDRGKTFMIDNVRVDSSTMRCDNLRTASCGNALYAVWQDNRSGGYDVYFCSSFNSGMSWMADKRIDTAPAGADSIYPQIAASGSRVYVLWVDHRNISNDVFFNYSSDFGFNFQAADVRLDNTIFDSSGAQIACSDNCVYAIWMDGASGARNIYFNRSLDGGGSWIGAGGPVQLTTSAAIGDMRLACSGSRVYVVWEDTRSGSGDVYVRYSKDCGVTWQNEARIDTDAGVHDSQSPALACSGQCVYVAWKDNRSGNFDVYFNVSGDAGGSWLSADRRVDTDAVSNGSGNPSMACSGDLVYVAWPYSRNGSLDIYLQYSADSGLTWQANDIRIDSDYPGSALSSSPAMAASGNDLHIAWIDSRNSTTEIWYQHGKHLATPAAGIQEVRIDHDSSNSASKHDSACWGSNIYVVWEGKVSSQSVIFFNKSTDGGATWQGTDLRVDHLSGPGLNAFAPRIACWGENVYVVWVDNRTSGSKKVFFNKSTDAGSNWMGADIRIDGNPVNDCNSPQIACWGRNVYVIWEDNTSGVPTIRGTRSQNEGSVGTWMADIPVDVFVAGELHNNPKLACSGSYVYAVWERRSPGLLRDILFNLSTNAGGSWDPSSDRLDTDIPGSADSSSPQIACSGSFVHAVWQDNRSGSWEVFMNFSLSAGTSGSWQSFDMPLNTTSANASQKPCIAVSGSRVHAAWENLQTGVGNDVFARLGTVWGSVLVPSDVRLDGDSSGAFTSEMPCLAASGPMVFSAWADTRNTSSQVFGTWSDDAGQTWAASQTRLDTNAGSSSVSPRARALIWGNDLYATWDDGRSGGQGIYFNYLK